MKKFPAQILFFALLCILLSFSVKTASAQTCRSFCEPDDPTECQECVPVGEWFCLNYGSAGTCCHCICGTGGSSDYGPIDCVRGGDGNRYGCLPCTSPTSAVQPSPTPIACCTGSDFCKYIEDYYDCENNDSCSWVCDVPDLTPSPAWWCLYPNAEPYHRCRYETITVCFDPNEAGGACYTNQDDCEHSCVLTGSTITPKPAINILTPCAERGYINSLDTAVGCFPAGERNEMLSFIMRWSLGVAGGISFLLIVYGAFVIMGSGANPERVKAGKGILTASIAGLILIIFSVFILDFFGLRILRIPGL